MIVNSQLLPVHRHGRLYRVLRPRLSGLIGGSLLTAGLIMLSLTVTSPSSVQAGASCQPNTAYALPTPVSLTSAHNGLTIHDSGISTYGVGGDTVASLRSALTSCAPTFDGASTSGDFLAYTSYSIDWGYRIEHVSSTTCRLGDVKVGLHVSQLMPTLLSDQVPSDISQKWASFHAGLQDHENGHKDLDIAQSQKLLTALERSSGSCVTLGASTQSLITSSLQELITLNADHDSATHSGRDQGAVW